MVKAAIANTNTSSAGSGNGGEPAKTSSSSAVGGGLPNIIRNAKVVVPISALSMSSTPAILARRKLPVQVAANSPSLPTTAAAAVVVASTEQVKGQQQQQSKDVGGGADTSGSDKVCFMHMVILIALISWRKS